jgi:nicotinamidase-related amidase
MLVILDMQVGLFSLVRDYDPQIFWNSMMAHARTAKAFELPVVMTTSAQKGQSISQLPHLQFTLQMWGIRAAIRIHV